MVAHGLITGMLFFVAGSVQHTYGTREMSRLGGLLKQAPKMGWILGSARWPRSGSPGSPASGVSSRRCCRRTSRRAALSDALFRTFMVIAAIGTVLAAGYLLWMYQRVAFGEPKPEFADTHIHDVSTIEWIAWTPLLLLIVVLGVYPDTVFSLTNDGVAHIAHVVRRWIR